MIANPGRAVEPHDEQQAQVVERLRAANGAPVSFAELRAMGVENPALLCYELAAVGLPVERPRQPGSGVLTLSVRLQPEPAGVAQDAGQRDGRRQLDGASGDDGRERRGSARPSLGEALHAGRPLAAGALALTLAVVLAVALALAGSPGDSATQLSADAGDAHARAHSQHADGTQSQASPTVGHVAQAAPTPTPQPKQVTVSSATAARLEAEGHQLLGAGSYAAAIADLRGAIQASGGSLSRCAEPVSEACLTYAYALYDLGRALQLDGHSAAAIPILSERLRIDNQREAVQQELDLARAADA